MENGIVKIVEKDLMVGTWDLSKGFEVEHRALTKLIEKYKNDFEQFGIVTSRMQQIETKKRGRIPQEYFLNEPQSVYLATLLTNNDTVRKFKIHLTKEFFNQRNLIMKLQVQRENVEWQKTREIGKTARKEETDAIKQFVDYAKLQGSQSADKYYMIITKMQNSKFVNLELLKQKFPNMRDVLDCMHLSRMSVADQMVSNALYEGMKLEKNYKDIYQDIKTRLDAFLMLIGSSPITKIIGSI